MSEPEIVSRWANLTFLLRLQFSIHFLPILRSLLHFSGFFYFLFIDKKWAALTFYSSYFSDDHYDMSTLNNHNEFDDGDNDNDDYNDDND